MKEKKKLKMKQEIEPNHRLVNVHMYLASSKWTNRNPQSATPDDLEMKNENIIFDFGQCDSFLNNVKIMCIRLIRTMIFSHSHSFIQHLLTVLQLYIFWENCRVWTRKKRQNRHDVITKSRNLLPARTEG